MDTDRRKFIKFSVVSIGYLALKDEAHSKTSNEIRCEVRGEYQAVEDMMFGLEQLEHLHHGFPVNQLEHSLQTATMARNAGESTQIIVASLCHDVGKIISAFNHEAIAAERLRPFLSDDVYHMMKYHGIFQGRYFWDKIGRDEKTYLKYKNESWFDLAMRFTEKYDARAFKRNFPTDSLGSFLPELREILGGSSNEIN